VALIGTKQGVSYAITAKDGSQAAIDSAKSGLQGLATTTDRMAARMKTTMNNLRRHWMGVVASIAAAGMLIRKAWSMADQAAQYQEQIRVLNALGAQYNMTGDIITRNVKESARGLVSLAQAADMSANAMNLGLNPRQIYELTAACETLTDITGDDVPAAFNRMVIAAAAGRTQTLAQMGIIVDLNTEYKRYAESLGRNVKSLSELEKQQVRVNVILEAAKEKAAALGPTFDTNKDKMDRLLLTIKDIQLFLGTGMIRAVAGAAGAFQWLSAGALSLYGYFQKLMVGYAKLRAVMSWGNKEMWTNMAEGYRRDAEDAFAASQELTGKAMNNFEAMLARSADIQTAMALNKQQVRAEEAIQDEADVEKKQLQAKTFMAIAAEMYKYELALIKDKAKTEQNVEKKRLNNARKYAQTEKQIKASVFSNSVALLMMMGEKNKEFAALGIAISTGAEMIRAYQATIAASTLAFASQLIPGDPTSIARATAAAAATKAWGMVNVALIGTIGAMRVAATMSGGPSETGTVGGYSPTSPVETIESEREEEQKEIEKAKKSVPLAITIHNYGVIGADMDHVARELVPAIRKAEADGV
jgi:hypothetical protein